ncbi:MAG: class I SAM-dependent methyltransferase, partial [Kiloniellales bacterium]
MGFYDRYVLPWVLHLAMKHKDVTRWRKRVVPAARGRVLEVGIGSGLNLPFYSSEVEAVWGLDPSEQLLRMARKAAGTAPFGIELVNRGAEEIPFDDDHFDSVLTTWTLCSIPDATKALEEMRRVLKPDGELIFIEHGLAPERRVAGWQRRLSPLWGRVTGGCNLDREMDAMIRGAGFAITRLETGYLIKGPRPLTYHYEG